VHEALPTVVVVVVAVAAVIAVAGWAARGRAYDEIGGGGLSLHHPEAPIDDAPGERDAEIRQLLAAANDRRLRRGEEVLDFDAELARLTQPEVDPQIEREIRDLVAASNTRRVRQGLDPLDVEAEVRRRLQALP
jgi:hypothetical protein